MKSNKFNTYVINLNKDRYKYSKIKKDLFKIGINPIRFDAIYGKKIKNKYDKYLTQFSKLFTPFSIIGCGLSHTILAEQLYKYDKNYFSLVVEDDAVPLFKNSLEIEKVVANAPKDWDIILLYCQGLCNYKNNSYKLGIIPAGAVAYLINKTGQEKSKNIKLISHIDLQRYGTNNLKIYKSPKPLFTTDESTPSTTSNEKYNFLKIFDYLLGNIFDCDLSANCVSKYFTYKILRIPYINIEFDVLHIICLILITIIYYK
jgi:GR25 family glycosyltransferase involved in LPS biosynthesis